MCCAGGIPGARRDPSRILKCHRLGGRGAPLRCRGAAGARGAVPGRRQRTSRWRRRRRLLCLGRSRRSGERAAPEGAGAPGECCLLGPRLLPGPALPPQNLGAPVSRAPAPPMPWRPYSARCDRQSPRPNPQVREGPLVPDPGPGKTQTRAPRKLERCQPSPGALALTTFGITGF